MEKIINTDPGTIVSTIAQVDETGKPVIEQNIENESVTPSLFPSDDAESSKEVIAQDAENSDLLTKQSIQEINETEVVNEEKSLAEEQRHDKILEQYQEMNNQYKKLEKQLTNLHNDFQVKLQYDQHKEKIIDNLHRELQAYRNDILKKLIQPIIMNIIQMIDDYNKLKKHYEQLNPEELEPLKLLNIISDIPEELNEILYRQNVEPYHTDQGKFDPKKQRVSKKIQTTDSSLDKIVSKKMRPGYIWEDKIMRPEMVEVYVYDNSHKEVDTKE